MPEENTNLDYWQSKIQVGKVTHKGMVRTHNEDTLLSIEPLSSKGILEEKYIGLFAVADGLGGYEGGEIASSLALRVLAENIVKSLFLSELGGKPSVVNDELISKVLTQAVRAANSEIYAQSQVQGNNMSTTLVAALLVNNTAYIANVGDSRIYLLQGEELRQITTDHSLVAALVAAGEITPEEVYAHPRRNVITRCLGIQQSVEADLFTKVLKPGNSLLLCSDGLWEMVRNNEIRDVVLRAQNPQAACEQLVELANQNGGVDNISVIVVKVTG